ncbi:hypothetical protein AB9P05_01590 [Roseivirga sp. BDSF3-8]
MFRSYQIVESIPEKIVIETTLTEGEYFINYPEYETDELLHITEVYERRE